MKELLHTDDSACTTASLKMMHRQTHSPQIFSRIKLTYVLLSRKAPSALLASFILSRPILNQNGWNHRMRLCLGLAAAHVGSKGIWWLRLKGSQGLCKRSSGWATDMLWAAIYWSFLLGTIFLSVWIWMRLLTEQRLTRTRCAYVHAIYKNTWGSASEQHSQFSLAKSIKIGTVDLSDNCKLKNRYVFCYRLCQNLQSAHRKHEVIGWKVLLLLYLHCPLSVTTFLSHHDFTKL